MRQGYNKLLMLLLSALMTLMGTAGCKSLRFSRKAILRQQQAYNDSVASANAMRDQLRQDSIGRANARADFVADSIKRAEYLERTKTIYGGPNMMDRRFRNQRKAK